MKCLITLTLSLIISTFSLAQKSTQLTSDRIQFNEDRAGEKAFIHWTGINLLMSNNETGSADLILNTTDDIQFETGIANEIRMTLNEVGNLGIGTPFPSERLEVVGESLFRDENGIATFQSSGNNAFLSFTTNNDEAGADVGYFNDGTDLYYFVNTPAGSFGEMTIRNNGEVGFGSLESIPDHLINVNGNIALTNSRGRLGFFNGTLEKGTVRMGASDMHIENLGQNSDNDIFISSFDDIALRTGADFTRRININGDGRVSIGDINVPNGFLLAIDGNTICEEVQVELSGNWPDYVFQSDYNLRSLSDLADFINKNGHLPNVPSEDEIEAQGGVQIGATQQVLLEKIEELTLYILQQQQEIDALKKAIAE